MPSKTFDEILEDLLDDYENQLPDVDRSPGSLLHIKAAALASAIWGVYKRLEYVERAIHPGTSNTVNLDKHCADYGIDRQSGETDSELLTRLLNRLQNPPSGTNETSWKSWADGISYDHGTYVETVDKIYIFENGRGPGTIDVAITSDRTTALYEGVPTSELVAAVTTNIESNRPLGIWDFDVHSVAHADTTVTMAVTGVTTAQKTQIENAITSFMNTLGAGETLHVAQLIAIAINYGATTVSVSSPSSDVVPTASGGFYERVYPLSVTVN